MSQQVYLVNYEIQGPVDAPETGVCSAFELDFGSERVGEVPTVSTLRDSFPYVGSYHFRAKIRLEDGQYAWLDLTDEAGPLPVWEEDQTDSQVFVRALPLSFDGPDCCEIDADDEWDERDFEEDPTREASSSQPHIAEDDDGSKASWSKQLKEVTGTVLQSDVARDLTKKGITVGKQVGKQVGKLWNSLKAAATEASTGGPTPSLPSPAARGYLQNLERLLTTTVNDANCARHLQTLWACLFIDDGFERSSARWKLAGFQSEDPLPDFRGTGLLGIQCMIHLATNHPSKMQHILREQSGRSAKSYPYAVVANNVTIMIIETLKLRDKRYAGTPAVFWGLFEDGAPVLEELFTYALFFIDRIWLERNATRDQFPKLIQQTRQQLETVLSCAPLSLDDFQRHAVRQGFSI